MKNYAQFGIYDFSDFAEELESDELIFVNGGSCGGGCGGGASGGGVTTSSNSISISTCGGGTVYATGYYGTCAGGTVTSAKTYSSGVGTCGGASVPSYQSCGGGAIRQICIKPKDYHCDIYAWNLAIDNGLNPNIRNQSQIDLNRYNVSQMYDYYYKGYTLQTKGRCPEKTKGLAFYDGTNDGVFNPTHVEYFDSVNGAPGEYIQYKTDGIDTPQKNGRSLTDSRNTNWTYVALK